MNRPRIPTAILDAKGSLLHHPELRDSSEPTGRQMSKTVPKDFACVDACPEVCHHAEQRRLWKELMKMMAPGVALASDRWAVIHLVTLEAKSRAGLTSNAEEMRLLHYFTAVQISRDGSVGLKKNGAFLVFAARFQVEVAILLSKLGYQESGICSAM